jgi:hypothetical protein
VDGGGAATTGALDDAAAVDDADGGAGVGLSSPQLAIAAPVIAAKKSQDVSVRGVEVLISPLPY